MGGSSLERRYFPEMMSLSEWLKAAINTAEELRVLDAIYEILPCRNFSSHLLQCAPDRLAVIEMRAIAVERWWSPPARHGHVGKARETGTVCGQAITFSLSGITNRA